MSGTVTCSFDFNATGKQTGYLRIGDSTNNSGWTTFQVPIVMITNGSGPTVLVLAGNHGDEYEGQIAASSLSRELQPEEVTGRVIIIPCLSQEASRAGTRLWPNGANFNRVFPGVENGSLDQKLAFFMSNDLFPICDGVLDMHSGGRSMYFIPSSNMVWVADPARRVKMIKNMLAWNTSVHMIGGEQPSTNPYALLNREAERQGKSVSTGEFGGSGYSTPETIKIIGDGLRNFLQDFGVLKTESNSRVKEGLKSAKIIDFRDPAGFVSATKAGIYENCVPLGGHVNAGDVVGKIHDFDHPDVAPTNVTAAISGVISVIRGFPPVTTGDVVCVVGKSFTSLKQMEEVAG
ncbi:MAG: succinylglutamate desuccinylase/aspartoacylase family protein [Actinobacteria bacterium]|nr:succinylglutamate desuccinylase/aspartoacylase family protein [Actinomycetota bacterium]